MHLSWIAIGFQIIEIWATHTSSANIYSSNLGQFSADITPGEISRHYARYQTEKNIVSAIARIEPIIYKGRIDGDSYYTM